MVIGDSLECNGHEIRVQGPEGSEEGEQQSADPGVWASRLHFIQETVVGVPWEAPLKGKWSQETVRSLRTASFRQKKGPSHR